MAYITLPSAGITEAQMDEMSTLARLGRFPSSVTVSLENDAGVEYGNRDGSHKVWNNKANPHVPISSVKFDMAISEPEPQSTRSAIHIMPPM
jgi:hypothetical protein